ncbi:hypothetical protein GOP47_0009375 [Adiantum capillus-veneris]|uniref:Uncharacterized protein n=1 Tax=Adiantum capillus-veneris TaxID=13818 RepID=A0A9D4UWS1_ADICA|nr:hypothetical protein GOP47_0009375 [Adiantum capillus-veneris]
MDQFSQQKDGSRTEGDSKDTALWHYIPRFNKETIRIIHNKYTNYVSSKLYKCRALRSVL